MAFTVFYMVSGVLFGILIGNLMRVINPLKSSMNSDAIKELRLLISLVVASSVPLVCNYIDFKGSKNMTSISFGYTAAQIWGEDKPRQGLSKAWKYFTVILFGTVGALL